MGEPTKEELKSLEERAREVVGQLTKQGEPPIVAIEFAGSPKAGKSTNIDTVTHFFKRLGLKVWAPTEGVSKRTPYHLKHDWVYYNSWALNYAISELIIGYHYVDKHHLVILDRGPFDSLAWMSLLKKQGKLTGDEYQRIERFALHPKWSDLIDKLYLFTCDPGVSMERELALKLIKTDGSALNHDTLSGLLDEYEALQDHLDGEYSGKILPITTSKESTPKQSAYQIAKDVIEIFERKLDEAGNG